MLGRFRPRLTYANVISTVCLFVLLGGGAWAASSFVDSKGKIHGCVDRKGVLTLVKAGKKCGKHRSQITWSQRGPQGRTGLQGRTGTVNTSNFFTKAQSDGRFMRGAGNAAKIDYRCDTSIANTCEDTPLPVLSIDDLT